MSAGERCGIGRIADGWCRVLQTCSGLLLALTAGLILLNVVTRTLQLALFWVDELAVYCMIWSALSAAATTIRRREAIAVRLLPSLLPPRANRYLQVFCDLAVTTFAGLMLAVCWLWFDPLLLVAVDFDIDAFIRNSYNFVYRDPTHTLGIPRFWVWLAMPVMAFSLALFSVANLVDSLCDFPGSAFRMSRGRT